jgi:nitrogenase molybdenum-iron protein alpha/beta subunit
MPRYFFHLVKGSKIAGHECANDHAAQKLARQGDGFSSLDTLPSDVSKHYHIQVLNEAGQTVVTVPFSDLRVV